MSASGREHLPSYEEIVDDLEFMCTVRLIGALLFFCLAYGILLFSVVFIWEGSGDNFTADKWGALGLAAVVSALFFCMMVHSMRDCATQLTYIGKYEREIRHLLKHPKAKEEASFYDDYLHIAGGNKWRALLGFRARLHAADYGDMSYFKDCDLPRMTDPG
ncbi:hypothetical protein HYW18_03465 [Candidatus Uhrbacteria bacterium]|nr:hypothetical protein [Candidatus Uhrbacteria bacterium]